MHTNFVSEQPDAGLMNRSSFNHIKRINEHVLYICTNGYLDQGM